LIKRLHICLLTSGRVFEVKYGGEERFTISLGKWLARLGYDITLMGSGFMNVKAKHLSKDSIEVEEQKTKNKKQKIQAIYPPYTIYFLSRLILSFLWVLKILSINIRSPITLIHAQDTGYSGLAAVISGKILRIPIIITSHGIRHRSLESIIQGRLKKILLKVESRIDIFTIKNASGVLSVNSSIKNYFEQLTYKKIDVIPIPIKLKDFEFSEVNRELIRKELGINKKSIIVGFVGRFSPEKNLLNLLISFADVVQDNPVISLVLVGAGSLESQLREYVSKRGIEDKVMFCGVRYDINKILSSFDIFVLPSYIEGLSTALLEAMACGRALIVSDIPASHELLTHNHDALLVNPHNPEEIESAIHLLCNDNSLRLKLGHNAKIRVNEYDEDMVFPQILKYYESLYKTRENKN
jgi:glycosyltransferase involved in cell wall biosynthesis